ncbi:MAG TPA: hypothetical protein VLT34_18465 [Arthrobacter sp.]|nr:hypothetical protein [Arthrobacter sp.]
MALGDEESEQRRRFAESLRHADVSVEELWLRYFTLGGQAGQFEVEAYIHGAMALPALQRDILAHALNERLDELYSGAPRAPYTVDVQVEPAENESGIDSGAGSDDEAGGGSEADRDDG